MIKEIRARIIGTYHFLGDVAPGNSPLVEPRARINNPWAKDGKALVTRVRDSGDLRAAVEKAISLPGNLNQIIGRGDKVFLKPNYNNAGLFPAATSLDFLEIAIETLKDLGAKITVGESAGGVWRPTKNVFNILGLFDFARKMNVELIPLDDRPEDWVKVKIRGRFFPTISIPRSAYEADKLVYLPGMKTHFLASFSGALKLTMGLLHPGNRRSMHLGNLQSKIAEINLWGQPDLILMDGRKAFVTGGPARGKIVEPGVIMASGDQIGIDVEAVRELSQYRDKNTLPADPWDLPQIRAALSYGLGAGKGNHILVV